MSSRLSLDVGKTEYALFHKPSGTNALPRKLAKLSINNQVTKRTSYTKFLGCLLDENASWKKHLKYTENKIGKSIGLMHKAKLKDKIISYIH